MNELVEWSEFCTFGPMLIEYIIYISFSFQLCPDFIFRCLLKKCSRGLTKQSKNPQCKLIY